MQSWHARLHAVVGSSSTTNGASLLLFQRNLLMNSCTVSCFNFSTRDNGRDDTIMAGISTQITQYRQHLPKRPEPFHRTPTSKANGKYFDAPEETEQSKI